MQLRKTQSSSLALKVEEEVTSQGMQQAPESGKDFSLEPPDKCSS